MMVKTYNFPGGVHPFKAPGDGTPHQRYPIRIMPAPDRVVIPMLRVTGASLTPLVRRGDFVRLGQKIADSDAFSSAPAHASVSGKVVAVEPRLHPSGRRLVPSVVIENDHQDTWDESCTPVDSSSGEEIIRIAREKGIVGLGGATFPTHVKLRPPAGSKVDVLVVNGAECEPILSADDALMRERSGEVIGGIALALKALGAERAVVGIEENKSEAIRAMAEAAKGTEVKTVPLRVRYPQGGEKQLIYALTGRRVPLGALPSAVGCVVLNVGTLAALWRAVAQGRPLIDRVVTIAGGAVPAPANLQVRIGTSFRACVEFCGGYAEGGPEKIIAGGPMMGMALHTDEVPVIAGTSGIVALSGAEAIVPEPSACVRCGRCHRVCPMRLQPYAIEEAYALCDAAKAARFGAHSCIECGACGYICPARRHLVQSVRMAKALVLGSAARKQTPT